MRQMKRGMEGEFTVRTAQLGSDTYVVSVTGEADLHTSSEIEDALEDVLRRDGRSVALDLAEVSFIDSSALAMLLKMQPRFKVRGGDLLLVSDDRRVLRTLEITGLDRILRIENRLASAVEGLYGGMLAHTADPV